VPRIIAAAISPTIASVASMTNITTPRRSGAGIVP
jgi:hypothetical protein